MNQKLLMRVKLEGYRCIYRKSCVLAMMNIVLGMNHWTRRNLHDDMMKTFSRLIKEANEAHPFGHTKEAQYRVSIGYYRGKNVTGKKTKTIDADGLSYIGKVAIDSLIKCTSIPNDSIFVIPEFRCVYLGERDEEEIWLQVTKDIPDEKIKVDYDSERIGVERSEDRKHERGVVGSSQVGSLQSDEQECVDGTRRENEPCSTGNR
jgi:hypothetical protein